MGQKPLVWWGEHSKPFKKITIGMFFIPKKVPGVGLDPLRQLDTNPQVVAPASPGCQKHPCVARQVVLEVASPRAASESLLEICRIS